MYGDIMKYRDYLIKKNKAFKNDFFFKKTVNIFKFDYYKETWEEPFHEWQYRSINYAEIPINFDNSDFKVKALDLIDLLKTAKKNKISFFNKDFFHIFYTEESKEDSTKRVKMSDETILKVEKKIDNLFKEIKEYQSIKDIFISEDFFNIVEDKCSFKKILIDKFVTKNKTLRKKKIWEFEKIINIFWYFNYSIDKYLTEINDEKIIVKTKSVEKEYIRYS